MAYLTLHVDPLTVKAAQYTLTPRDAITLANGTFAVYLYEANAQVGQVQTVRNIGSGTVTLTANGTEKVDGASTLALGPGSAVRLTSDGTEWWTLSASSLTANDADYLDGQHGSYYTNATNLGTGTVSAARLTGTYANVTANDATYAFGKSEAGLNVNSAVYANNATYAYGKTEDALNVNTALTANQLNGATVNTNASAVLVGANVYINTSAHFVGNTSVNAVLTSSQLTVNGGTLTGTNYSGTANNATNAFGKAEGDLNVNNATNLGGQGASYYTNATNIATGTLPDAQLSSNVVLYTNANTANKVLATPDGVSGNLTLRALTAQDVRNLDERWEDINRCGFARPGNAETTIAFNPITYQFTLANVASTWEYFLGGIDFLCAGPRTVTLPGTPPANGTFYVTVNGATGQTATLVVSTDPWSLALGSADIPVAMITWNDSLTPKFFIADERHTVGIDRAMHAYLHTTRGTQYASGCTPNDFTFATSTNAALTFSLTPGSIYDEDVLHTITGLSDPDGETLAYPVFYRVGANTYNWALSEVPFQYTPSGYINYDNAGTMTEGQTAKYYNTFLVLTSSSNVAGPNGSFMMIPGREEYSSNTDAYTEDPLRFDFTGLPISESVIIDQFTWHAVSSFGTKGHVQLDRVNRLNLSLATASVGSILTDHNTLQSLQGGNPGEFFHITAAQWANGITANNATYAYGKSEGALNVNSATYAYGGTSEGALNVNNAITANQLNGGTVNTNAIAVLVGANVYINTSAHFVGNTSVNAVLTSSQLTVNGGTLTGTNYSGTANDATNAFGKTEGNLNVNSAVTAYGKSEGALNVNNAVTANQLNGGTVNTNAIAVLVGANVYINTGAYFVGNTSVNATLTSSQLTINGATLDGVSYSGTANNATYAFGKTEGNLNVNSATTAYGKAESALNVNSAVSANQLNGGTVNTNAIAVLVGANVYINTSAYFVGNSTVNVVLTSSQLTINGATLDGVSYSGTANNATYAFGKTEGNLNVNNATTAYGKSEGNLNVNNATTADTANNATYAFGKSEGALNVNSALNLNGGTVQTNASGLFLGANLVLNTSAIFVGNSSVNNWMTGSAYYANGTAGPSGYVLTSNGSASYWGAVGTTTASYLKLDTIADQFNGVQTVFTLKSGGSNVAPASSKQVMFSLGGIWQEPDVAYSISGNTVNFASAPYTGTSYFGVLIGSAIDIGNISAGVDINPRNITATGNVTVSGSGGVKVNGTVLNPMVSTLVDGATPPLDASLGTVFRLAAAGDRTIAVPSNAVAGQKITIEHYASGGSRTLSLNTGAGGFRFGADITGLTITSSGKTDYIEAIYNGIDSRWDVIAVVKGY